MKITSIIKNNLKKYLSAKYYKKINYSYKSIQLIITKLYSPPHSNSIEEQRLWANKWLQGNDPEYSSKGWGYVDRYNPGLGDYSEVRKLLISKCYNKRSLDLGCLDGKWAEVMAPHAKFITLVDLSDELLPTLKKKIGKFNFYKTKGDELLGINSNSIDFIFSMDSLVRVPNLNYLRNYFSEFKRILTPQGEILIHLPCNQISGCRMRGFTRLSLAEIKEICHINDFIIKDLNMKILEHGILLSASKS
jgi:SAM-dependent methyltransferase